MTSASTKPVPPNLPTQLSVSGPMPDEEMAKLRACLLDEINLPEGADPTVHGLYDYYETTKRLFDTVVAFRIKLSHLRAVVGVAIADIEQASAGQRTNGDLVGALMDTGLSTPIEQTWRAVVEFAGEEHDS